MSEKERGPREASEARVKSSESLHCIIEEEGLEEAVRARVIAAWGKWRDLSEVISDTTCQGNKRSSST